MDFLVRWRRAYVQGKPQLELFSTEDGFAPSPHVLFLPFTSKNKRALQ